MALWTKVITNKKEIHEQRHAVMDHRGTSISKSRQRCQSRQEKPQGLQLAQLSSLGLKVESQSDDDLRL